MSGVQRSSGFHISDILDLNDPKVGVQNDAEQTSLSPNGKFSLQFISHTYCNIAKSLKVCLWIQLT